MGRARPALERPRPRICRGPDQVPALHGPAPAALEPVPRGLLLPREPAGLCLARPRARRPTRPASRCSRATRPARAFAPCWARTSRRRRRRADRSCRRRRPACCARPAPRSAAGHRPGRAPRRAARRRPRESTRHDFARSQRPAARGAVRRGDRRRHLRAHSRRAMPTGCCASCSPRPGARSCCGSRSRPRTGVGSEDWWRRRVEADRARTIPR